ncbi:MAG TPA: hypothetical protein VG269_25595 [Tepidisphaeraceae bacterium]|jgi:hypothetical protein|nr:hypothetical protein [Tepidisphaeraceae bacterium]
MMYDLHLAREPAESEIAASLGDAFGVTPGQIVIVAETAGLDFSSPNVLLVVQRTRRGGGFPCSLSVYPQTTALASRAEDDIARAAARCLHCDCLISDDSPNPYSWQIISPDGTARHVFVDVNAFDDRGEFRFANSN